ncbi:MAG TPA: acyl carrier protein [Dehalococcoidia bacterium]|nr:acyl carrier protein [Dehalococcoidia bacterium]
MSVEETLRKIVTRVTRKPESAFTPQTTFEDLDADSLDIVQVLVALEDTYDIEIQDEELQEIKNMGDFIAYVECKIGEKGKQA